MTNAKTGHKGFFKKQNDFRILNGIVFIDISTKAHPSAECMIDEVDLPLIIDGKGRWYASSFGIKQMPSIYALRKSTSIKMHRIIMNAKKGEIVDHINRNSLDNRRSNLRIATHIENCRNARLKSDNKSGIRGVHWAKHAKSWVAQIRINGKTKHLGCFLTIEEAAAARKEQEKLYNFHPDETL